jgi:hypothetical protein
MAMLNNQMVYLYGWDKVRPPVMFLDLQIHSLGNSIPHKLVNQVMCASDVRQLRYHKAVVPMKSSSF